MLDARSNEARATLFDCVPTVYYYLLAHPDFERLGPLQPAPLWVGGQTLPAAEAAGVHERTGGQFHELWGMTELAGPQRNASWGPASRARSASPSPAM